MFEPISVSLLPNTFKKDISQALKLLLRSRQWLKGGQVHLLEKDFERLFPGFGVVSFLTGRTALLAILKSLGIGKGDEVLLQAFTCVVVPNAIIKAGAVPVYVDIKKSSFNMDPRDLEKKITPKSRAIIVQHTFGYPAEMEKILILARKHQLKIIEDCAHGINIDFGSQKLGMFGQAAFFSFGRDKVISSTFGGMAIIKNSILASKVKDYQKTLSWPSKFWLVRQLLYPVIFALLLPVYNFFSLGKLILVFCQFLKLFSWPVEKRERKGFFPKYLLARLPNSLASLARLQLGRLKKFNLTREKITALYARELKNLPVELPQYQVGKKTLPLLRFTIKTPGAQDLYRFAKKRGVVLNNWYYPPISPVGVDYQAVDYAPKKCPVAEKVAPTVVNLPTHPKMDIKKAKKVVKIIKEFFKNHPSTSEVSG
jgi:dTDP-4-amino-4,6-dideoxygalactose transaminase